MSADGKWGVVMEGSMTARSMTLTIEPAEVTKARVRTLACGPVKVLGDDYTLAEAYDRASSAMAAISRKLHTGVASSTLDELQLRGRRG